MAKTRKGLPVVRDATLEGLKTLKLPFPPSGKAEWTADDLEYTCETYRENVDEWRLLEAAVEGVQALVRLGVIERNERESPTNFDRRAREMYGFDYSRAIVELFAHYLSTRPVHRDIGALQQDPLWELFAEDCDFMGSRYEDYLTIASKAIGTFGHVGIMVDKPAAVVRTIAEAKKFKVYPYLSRYTPLAILDWRWERNSYGKQQLVYLKVKEDDGTFKMFWRDTWQAWRKDEDSGDVGVKVGEGPNVLGEIPFVWAFNSAPKRVGVGQSDISTVARVDVSLVRNFSQGEEIISYAAFPMMRKPMARAGEQDGADDVGVTAVLEFDPENPAARPDWLNSEVAGPLGAIMEWAARKVREIYRASNTGGISATEVSTDAKSGAALEAEFVLLNAQLCAKAAALEHTEEEIIRLWKKWQGYDDSEPVTVERSRKYDVADLARDLDTTLTATTIVKSDTFSQEMQKITARKLLPTAPDELLSEIDAEIEEGPVEPTTMEAIAAEAREKKPGAEEPTDEDGEEGSAPPGEEGAEAGQED